MSLIRTLFRKQVQNIHLQRSNVKCTPIKYSTTASTETETDPDSRPIPYSLSPANRWQAKSSRMGTHVERLWYEPYVVFISLGILMLYFCLLREENDIDKQLDSTLLDQVKGLEEQQLLLTLQYNEEHNLETNDIKRKLKEIAKE